MVDEAGKPEWPESDIRIEESLQIRDYAEKRAATRVPCSKLVKAEVAINLDLPHPKTEFDLNPKAFSGPNTIRRKINSISATGMSLFAEKGDFDIFSVGAKATVLLDIGPAQNVYYAKFIFIGADKIGLKFVFLTQESAATQRDTMVPMALGSTVRRKTAEPDPVDPLRKISVYTGAENFRLELATDEQSGELLLWRMFLLKKTVQWSQAGGLATGDQISSRMDIDYRGNEYMIDHSQGVLTRFHPAPSIGTLRQVLNLLGMVRESELEPALNRAMRDAIKPALG